MQDELSLLGLLIQATGIAALTILSALLARSIPRASLRYWTAAWGTLTIALVSLFISLVVPSAAASLQPVYLAGEFGFGYLLVAGFRHYASGATIGQTQLWIAPAALLLAVALHRATDGAPRVFFIPHAAIIALLFALAFWTVRCAPRVSAGSGRAIVQVSLALLAFKFLLYVPVFAYTIGARGDLPIVYLRYSGFVGVILEMLLGFGMITLVLEGVQRELETANADLRTAHDRVTLLARLDPLTQSLNRHAFYSLVEENRTNPEAALLGCVAFVDVDDLKLINDSYGHAAGDRAIRQVASSLRAQVRAHDLIFRWGGDEFLVLLFGLNEHEARSRLEKLNAALAFTPLPGAPSPVRISVSHGVASFTKDVAIDEAIHQAIERADKAMYMAKQKRRAAKP